MKNLLVCRMPKLIATATLLVLLLGSAFAFKVLWDVPACAITLTKQNVFYIGVDNPITVVVRGVPVEQVQVNAQGLTVQKQKGDNYIVNASRPGAGSITVQGGEMKPVTFPYRVKRIPDPQLLLGAQYDSGPIQNGVFKVQNGIGVVFGENFDFDVQCDVVGYEVTYLGKQKDPAVATNSGGRFNRPVQDLIDQAQPGDLYIFDEARVKCPGDAAARSFGSLVFRIR